MLALPCFQAFKYRVETLYSFCCAYWDVLCSYPGDGGVETAEEAVEPAEPDINELCTDMFEKMAIFLQGELTGLSALPNLQCTQSVWGTQQLHCLSTTRPVLPFYILCPYSMHWHLLTSQHNRHVWRLSPVGKHEQTHKPEVHGDERHQHQHQPEPAGS